MDGAGAEGVRCCCLGYTRREEGAAWCRIRRGRDAAVDQQAGLSAGAQLSAANGCHRTRGWLATHLWTFSPPVVVQAHSVGLGGGGHRAARLKHARRHLLEACALSERRSKHTAGEAGHDGGSEESSRKAGAAAQSESAQKIWTLQGALVKPKTRSLQGIPSCRQSHRGPRGTGQK